MIDKGKVKNHFQFIKDLVNHKQVDQNKISPELMIDISRCKRSCKSPSVKFKSNFLKSSNATFQTDLIKPDQLPELLHFQGFEEIENPYDDEISIFLNKRKKIQDTTKDKKISARDLARIRLSMDSKKTSDLLMIKLAKMKRLLLSKST